MVVAKQEQILQQLGANNPLVTAQQYSNTLRKIVELSGFKDPGIFFNQIPDSYQPPQPSQKPTPEQVLAQVQAESIQADIQKKAAELELKREEMMRNDDLQRDQMNQDFFIKKYELELKYQTNISNAEIAAAQAINREAMKQQAVIAQGMQQAPPVMQPGAPINPNSGMVQWVT